MYSNSILNRNQTYNKVYENLPESRRVVLATIFEMVYASLDQVCEYLDKTKNELSGRFTELKYFGFIKEVSNNISSRSNNRVTVYCCTSEQERIMIVNDLYRDLIDEKKSLESDYHKGISRHTLKMVKKRISQIESRINLLSKFAK